MRAAAILSQLAGGRPIAISTTRVTGCRVRSALDLRWNPLRGRPRWLDELARRGCRVYV